MQDTFTLVVTDETDSGTKNYVCIYELPLELTRQGEDAVIQKFKDIANQYLQTPEGQKELAFNCGSYTFLDFLNIPDSILESHGIKDIRVTSDTVCTVDGNELIQVIPV